MNRRTFFNWITLSLLSSFSFVALASIIASAQRQRFSASDSSQSMQFYVATNGDDTWSGKLETPNATKTDGPFATLQRARNAIRQVKSQQGNVLKQPITVIVRAGTYFLQETLVLTSKDSGTTNFSITYKAYPNEKPIISGAQRIVGWKKQDDLWVTKIPEVQTEQWNFRYLRVGDDWAIRARYPNFDPDNPYTEGFLFVKETNNASRTKKINFLGFDSDEFPDWAKTKTDWTGTEIHAYFGPKANWCQGIFPITGVDSNASALLGDFSSAYAVQVGARLFIENAKEALDSPNEWYLDRKTGELFYWATDSDFPNVEVSAPKLQRLLFLDKVAYLNFEGLTFSDCDVYITKGIWTTHGGIFGSNISNCKFEKCTFTLMGNNAIVLENNSNNNLFVGNLFTQLGESGIYLGQRATNPSQHCNNNKILANEISHIGKVHKVGFGIILGNANNCRVAYNYIHDIPARGIQLASVSSKLYSHNNLIEYNKIVNANLETSDSGAIYINGQSKLDQGNKIQYNYIENCPGIDTNSEGEILSPSFSFGIYLDHYTSGVEVFGNKVIAVSLANMYILRGRNNKIENNIFSDGTTPIKDVDRISTKFLINVDPKFSSNNKFLKNIVVIDSDGDSEDSLIQGIGGFGVNRVTGLSQCNNNLYWDIGGLDLKTVPEIMPKRSFSQWQALGFDRNSLIADPQFVDLQDENFRLESNSPALKMGFQTIPRDRIGIEGFSSRDL